MMHYLLILLIGYLLGCSNMAVYLAAAQNVDLRSGGSGKLGGSLPHGVTLEPAEKARERDAVGKAGVAPRKGRVD